MIKNIYMPNIGDYQNVIVTEIMVSENCDIKKNDKLIIVEYGKTSVDIISFYNGKIININITIGDTVKAGQILLTINVIDQKYKINYKTDKNLNKKKVEIIRLSSKKQISNNILFSSWTKIPHVTQFDNINISQLVNVYLNIKYKMKKKNRFITFLPFVIKALTDTLVKYPYFNASLYNKKKIILKKYYNIGIVSATKNGLLTPVIRNTDKKNIFELNNELLLNRQKIIENKLMPSDFNNSSFSISNLGFYTTNFFTPIIKYPDVSILGVSKYKLKPIIQKNKEVKLITVLPLSISYDHSVIDGLDCVNFIKCFQNNLNKIKSIYDE